MGSASFARVAIGIKSEPNGCGTELDADFFAHEPSSGLEGLVPGESPILPIELPDGTQYQAVRSPGIDEGSLERDLENDRTCPSADGEVSGDVPATGAHGLQSRAVVLNRR